MIFILMINQYVNQEQMILNLKIVKREIQEKINVKNVLMKKY